MVFSSVLDLFGPKIMSFPVEKMGLASPVPPNAWCLLADGGRWPVRCTACLPRFCKQRAAPSGILKGLAQWQCGKLIELMAGHFLYHDVGFLGELGDWKL